MEHCHCGNRQTTNNRACGGIKAFCGAGFFVLFQGNSDIAE